MDELLPLLATAGALVIVGVAAAVAAISEEEEAANVARVHIAVREMPSFSVFCQNLAGLL
jgi:hypothetical protein